jgi:NAD(P)-dependent dehydrogenase (short-subunit alcohol dehydrogenase family)
MSTKAMAIEGKAVLVTGANRGLGQALVEEALRRGATRVYAGTRQPLVHPDERVTPLTLDVTDPTQVQRAAEKVGSLDILINNAGVSLPAALSDRAALERHLAVNLFGTWGVTEAFLPLLMLTGGGVVNVVSLAAFAAVPVLPAYSISKAAAFSLSQSLRALFAGRGVRVHAVMAGPIDTDMVRDLDIPKTSPEAVAPGHLRRGGERGGRDLPRPDVREDGGELARWCGQGARAPERGAPRSRARRGMSNRRGRRASSARPEARRHCLRARPGSL